MIKLNRQAIPPELAQQIASRITQLHEHLEAGLAPPDAVLNSYRNPAVKSHLISEANGKCIYCESKVSHVYFGDVEHIKPKALFPKERLNIENLGFVCAKCNNAKSDYWDENFPVIDPYAEDPSVELMALGYYLARRPGSMRAYITLEQIKLNRVEMLERRKERIELLQPLIDQYATTPAGPIKELLATELRRQADDDAEYSLVVRAYLEACDIPRDADR